jgi:hypothetical protein
VLHLRVGQRRGNQQDRVRAVRARFDDLVLVEDKVLAQTRQRHGGGSQLQVAQAALKVGLIREHGERSGSAGAIAPRHPGRIEVRADHTLRRRSFLHLGDDSDPFRFFQRLPERGRGFCRLGHPFRNRFGHTNP